jgi:predicted NUDIX family NTP pyrophosphohydrolase
MFRTFRRARKFEFTSGGKSALGLTKISRQCPPVPRISAGLVMYRRRNGALEFFLVHPGGPFAARKDEGCWSIPKGEPDGNEPLLEAAQREFREETGLEPRGPFLELGWIQQKGGKWVHAWAFEGDCTGPLSSNMFTLEWPPGSGEFHEFPEVDRAEFFPLAEARRKIKERQFPLLERLVAALG